VTVNGICHTLWTDQVPASAGDRQVAPETHLCGRQSDHNSWHLCPCGAMLLTGRTGLTDEQRHHRSVDCPECLAKSGRPCHTTAGAVMTGVHATRAKAAG